MFALLARCEHGTHHDLSPFLGSGLGSSKHDFCDQAGSEFMSVQSQSKTLRGKNPSGSEGHEFWVPVLRQVRRWR